MERNDSSVTIVLIMVEWYDEWVYDVHRRDAMRDVTIRVMRKACYEDLSRIYENPIEHACTVKEGDVFVSHNAERPEGFCDSAWDSVKPFVTVLAHGGGNFYDGWMKNPDSAMISCNDGFRPVSFLLTVTLPKRNK